jgi:hypothetical protein
MFEAIGHSRLFVGKTWIDSASRFLIWSYVSAPVTEMTGFPVSSRTNVVGTLNTPQALAKSGFLYTLISIRSISLPASAFSRVMAGLWTTRQGTQSGELKYTMELLAG